MKHQQVVVDYWTMIKSSFTCVLLAFSGYILIKMVQTIFWLPGHLKSNQKRLEELAGQYQIDLKQLENEVLSDGENVDNLEKSDEIAEASNDKEEKKDL